jgi:hypothetical protein
MNLFRQVRDSWPSTALAAVQPLPFRAFPGVSASLCEQPLTFVGCDEFPSPCGQQLIYGGQLFSRRVSTVSERVKAGGRVQRHLSEFFYLSYSARITEHASSMN